MYTLRLVYASEGYRRIAWLALAAVTIWRAGYFYKGNEGAFFAWYYWLEWESRWLNAADEILLYILFRRNSHVESLARGVRCKSTSRGGPRDLPAR